MAAHEAPLAVDDRVAEADLVPAIWRSFVIGDQPASRGDARREGLEARPARSHERILHERKLGILLAVLLISRLFPWRPHPPFSACSGAEPPATRASRPTPRRLD